MNKEKGKLAGEDKAEDFTIEEQLRAKSNKITSTMKIFL